jgi:TRAP-type C4-dicarboxylate transport system substrate-binding protein
MIGSAARAVDYPKMKLRYANFLPEKAPNSRADIFVANEITKRTNGRVEVEIYSALRRISCRKKSSENLTNKRWK